MTAPVPDLSSGALPLAVISNSQTPYRLHLHRRIARELPFIELWSLFTHEVSNAPWRIQSPGEIRPVFFGAGEASAGQSSLRAQAREWSKAGRILNWLREREIRCVVLLGYNDAGRMRILEYCRKRSLPCFLFGDSNILGDTATGAKLRIKKTVVGRAVRSATGVFYCGTLGKQYFEKYGATPERAFPFPYEPDYFLFAQPPREAVEAARNRFGIRPGRRYLLYSGRLIEIKRVDLLLDAFCAIAARLPEWDLIIAGSGPLEATLKASIPRELAQRLLWTGFVEDAAGLAALYRCADALILPSDYEPWGVVVTEAAASGLALICSSAVGAAAEVLRDGVNGRVFTRGQKQSLIEALLTVLDAQNIDRMKTASPSVLAAWRQQADPVAGLCKALHFAGLLP